MHIDAVFYSISQNVGSGTLYISGTTTDHMCDLPGFKLDKVSCIVYPLPEISTAPLDSRFHDEFADVQFKYETPEDGYSLIAGRNGWIIINSYLPRSLFEGLWHATASFAASSRAKSASMFIGIDYDFVEAEKSMKVAGRPTLDEFSQQSRHILTEPASMSFNYHQLTSQNGSEPD